MLADGTLHLSAVSELAPHLRPHNVASLLAEATHRSKSEVERLVSRRFPKRDIATAVRPLADAITAASLTAQVVANMAQSPPPVAVLPMNSGISTLAIEPLPPSHEARGLHQVMTQVVAAAAARSGSEAVPDSMLAHIAAARSARQY